MCRNSAKYNLYLIVFVDISATAAAFRRTTVIPRKAAVIAKRQQNNGCILMNF